MDVQCRRRAGQRWDGRQAACAAGAQIAWAELRCFSRDTQKNKTSQRGWLGEGNLAPRFPAAWTCCCCPVCSLVSMSVLLRLSVLVPYLHSAASPALVLPFSSCFPFQDRAALLGHVSYRGTWVLSPPGTPQAVRPIMQTSHRGNIWLVLSGWERSVICGGFSRH